MRTLVHYDLCYYFAVGLYLVPFAILAFFFRLSRRDLVVSVWRAGVLLVARALLAITMI
jgi:hypothetical protein